MNPIDQYILKLAKEHQAIVLYLRDIIHKTLPEVKEKYNWSCPCYQYNGKFICYINIRKKKTFVELSFIKGVLFTQHLDYLIDGANRKQARSLHINHLSEINETVVKELLLEAVTINNKTKK